MADIGKMEQRLENVEQYISLTLAERELIDMSVTDENGLDRFKSGFVVDGFTDMSVANMSSPDFKCYLNNTIAPQTLRPSAWASVFNLVPSSTFNGGKITGGFLTLNYTEENMVNQSVASSSEFINPFDVVVFTGESKTMSNFDVWEDINMLYTDPV
jgi:hypothetical protein